MDEADEAFLKAIAAEAAADGGFMSSEDEDDVDMDEDEREVEEEVMGQQPPKKPEQHVEAAVAKPLSPSAAKFDAAQYELMSNKKTKTGEDGTVYEWDELRKLWFPIYQENLVEAQQSIYDKQFIKQGITLKEATDEDLVRPPKPQRNKKRKHTEDDEAAEEANKDQSTIGSKVQPKTVVYVTGMPTDENSVEEMSEFFKRCGIIKVDFLTKGPKIKLYKDDKGNLKGDGYVSYLREESVKMAIDLLDGTEYRSGYVIKVTQAEFTDKGNGAKKKKTKAEKRLIANNLKSLEKKLEWFDEGQKPTKHMKIAILKHMFKPEEVDEDPGIIIDLKEDIRSECEKLGTVTTVTVYDKHPDGLCAVKFTEPDAAAACVELMDGRYFAGARIEASIYDGTRYDAFLSSKEETDEEEAERLKRYGDWLEQQQQQQQPQEKKIVPSQIQPPQQTAQLQQAYEEQPATPPSDYFDGDD